MADDIIFPGDEETTRNNLYVLDKNLKLVSKIEGLAKGKEYFVRFDGDVGYFVTFKQMILYLWLIYPIKRAY